MKMRTVRKASLRLLIFVLAAGVAFTKAAEANDEPPRNIILIGWDGASRHHLKKCLGQGELPNLKKLISRGALVAIDNLRKTDTKAGWAQALTGYNPEITGVFSNFCYQPVPKGYTVFERLENYFGHDDFVTVAIIGKREHMDALPASVAPVTDKLGTLEECNCYYSMESDFIDKDGKRYRRYPAKPYYYTKNGVDVFINGLFTDDKVGAKALEYLHQYKDKPFFFFVHFAEIDENGHMHREDSKEYHEAFISADKWLGRIVQTLKKLNIYGKTLIYVTSDHGFIPRCDTHFDAPYVFLATNDHKVMRAGELIDIAPTILDKFGLDLNRIDPPLDGHPLTRPYMKPIWQEKITKK